MKTSPEKMPLERRSLEVRLDECGQANARPTRFSNALIRVGRHQGNDLVVRRPVVSRWHGVLSFNQDSIQYADLGSTNGTRLGRRVLRREESVLLASGSVLRIGEITLHVRICPSTGAGPESRLREALLARAQDAIRRTGPPDDALANELVEHWLCEPSHRDILKDILKRRAADRGMVRGETAQRV